LSRRLPVDGREDEVVGRGPLGGRAVGGQLVLQDGDDVDDANAGLGLRASDGDLRAGEVDVVPAQARRLVDPQTGEDERGHEAAPAAGPCLLAGVEVGRGVEHRDDLVGVVQVDGRAAARLELAVAGVDADRVARDEVALLGHGEDLAQAGDRLVDRLG
jgi:hypothetical protein